MINFASCQNVPPQTIDYSEFPDIVKDTVLKYALDNLSPDRFEEPDIDYAIRVRRGERLVYANPDLPDINRVEGLKSLRLVCRNFNNQTRWKLNFQRDDIAQEAILESLTTIAGIYRQAIERRVNPEDALKTLIKNIDQLFSQAVFETNGPKTLHMGMDLNAIYSKAPNWDVFVHVLNEISKQENIKTIKLDAPFLLVVENIREYVFSFLKKIVENPANTISAVRLNFSNNASLRFSDVKRLFETLKRKQVSIKELNLGRTAFDDADTRSLFGSLYDPDALKCLSLRRTPGSEQNIEIVQNAMKNNSALHTIDLGYIPSHPEGIPKLIDLVKKRSFEFLGIQGLDANCITRLLDEIDKNRPMYISRLNISGSTLNDDGMQRCNELLRNNTHIDELNLRECEIDRLPLVEALASGLAQNKFLKRLDLSTNHIGIDGIKVLLQALKNNTTLQKLKISSQARSDNLHPLSYSSLLEEQRILMAGDSRLMFGNTI